MIDTHHYYRAVKRANEAFESTGERQYILLQTDGKLIHLDRHAFKIMKKEKRLPSDTTINTLERECLYHTPYKNGTGACPKEKMGKMLNKYLLWKKADREHKKQIKRLSRG